LLMYQIWPKLWKSNGPASDEWSSGIDSSWRMQAVDRFWDFDTVYVTGG
jgi:hypothetical protein